MMEQNIIKVNNLSKKYKIYSKPHFRLLEWLTLGYIQKHKEFWALKDIDFDLSKGECIGIIGPNGAGKSTLLKILSKALWPSTGEIEIKGNMVSLLELGTGFHPELSGMDNIYNSAKLLGFSEEYINSKIQSILEFSELGDFIHQPVKSYSSGMYVRLAFSLFANLEPDIYVVDEALSVGDIFFQQKCFKFLQSLKEKGTGIILVTHDMQTVLKFCDKVIIVEQGQIIQQGDPVDMVNLYYSMGGKKQRGDSNLDYLDHSLVDGISIPLHASHNLINATGIRRGNKLVEILGAEILDDNNEEIKTVTSGEKIKLNIYAKANEDVSDLTFGYQITDRHNTVVFGQNSYMVTQKKCSAVKGSLIKATFHIEMNLFQGLYTFALAATDCYTEITNETYDWIEGCILLEVLRPSWREFHGVAKLDVDFNYESVLKQ